MAGPGPDRMGPRSFLTEEEKQNMPKVTKQLLARIAGYLKPYRLQFAFVFAAMYCRIKYSGARLSKLTIINHRRISV